VLTTPSLVYPFLKGRYRLYLGTRIDPTFGLDVGRLYGVSQIYRKDPRLSSVLFGGFLRYFARFESIVPEEAKRNSSGHVPLHNAMIVLIFSIFRLFVRSLSEPIGGTDPGPQREVEKERNGTHRKGRRQTPEGNKPAEKLESKDANISCQFENPKRWTKKGRYDNDIELLQGWQRRKKKSRCGGRI
jgi:hypothetical protein